LDKILIRGRDTAATGDPALSGLQQLSSSPAARPSPQSRPGGRALPIRPRRARGRHPAADSKHSHHLVRSCANMPVHVMGPGAKLEREETYQWLHKVLVVQVHVQGPSPGPLGPSPYAGAGSRGRISPYHPTRASPPGPLTWVKAAASDPIDLLGTLPSPPHPPPVWPACAPGGDHLQPEPNHNGPALQSNHPSRDGDGSPPCTRHS
jgi:hypothetical protein